MTDTTRTLDAAAALARADRVTVAGDEPAALLRRLAAAGVRDVHLDGGRPIQAFLHAGLVSTPTVTLIPLLLGRGRPLWGPLPADRRLSDQAACAAGARPARQRCSSASRLAAAAFTCRSFT
jgi:dihydrofolate reductase